MNRHQLTYHEAATICEMNPKYDGDIRDVAIREARVARMLEWANRTRSERRASGWLPCPFDNIDLAYLAIAREGGIKNPEEYEAGLLEVVR